MSEVLIEKISEYISEKLYGLMLLLCEFVRDVYPVTETVENLTRGVIDERRLQKMLEEVDEVVSSVDVITIDRMPTICNFLYGKYLGLNHFTCTVATVEKGNEIKVIRGSRYSLDVVIASDVGVYRRVDVTDVLIYKLMLLYKYTTLGSVKEFVNILKKYNIYNIVTEVSRINYVVKYPILDAAKMIFGGIIERTLEEHMMSKFIDRLNYNLKNKILRAVLDITKIPRPRNLELGVYRYLNLKHKTRLGFHIFSHLFITPHLDTHGGFVDCNLDFSKIRIADIISLIDEAVFSSAYFATVIKKLYEYL